MGYLDASVCITVSTGSSPSRVVIDVDVDEGPQYTVGRTMWRQRLLSSNSFAQLRELVSVPEGSPYDPGLVKRLQREIERFCVTLSPQQPDIAIRAMIDEQSAPLRPVVNIAISLRKARNRRNHSRGRPVVPLSLDSLVRAYLE